MAEKHADKELLSALAPKRQQVICNDDVETYLRNSKQKKENRGSRGMVGIEISYRGVPFESYFVWWQEFSLFSENANPDGSGDNKKGFGGMMDMAKLPKGLPKMPGGFKVGSMKMPEMPKVGSIKMPEMPKVPSLNPDQTRDAMYSTTK